MSFILSMIQLSIDIPLVIGETIFAVVVIYSVIKLWGVERIKSYLNIKADYSADSSISFSYPRIIAPAIENNVEDKLGHDQKDLNEIKHLSGQKQNAFHPWLEDLSSGYVKQWISDQRDLYKTVMSQEKYSSMAKAVSKTYQRFFANGIKTVHAPFQRGKLFFYYKKEKMSSILGESQPSLYYAKDIKQEGKVVLDAKNLLNDYGVILCGTWISLDGYKIVYGVSEWYREANVNIDMEMTLFIRDTMSGEDSEIDIIHGCRVDGTSVSWLEGHIGFFYTRYYYEGSHSPTSQSSGQRKLTLGIPRVYYHRMKTSQMEDLLIYEGQNDVNMAEKYYDYMRTISNNDEPFKIYNPIVSPDGSYLLIEEFNRLESNYIPVVQQSLSDELGQPCPGNRVYFRKLSIFDGKRVESIGPIQVLIDTFDYRFEYIVNIQDKFWFRTNYLASGFRVVQINMQGYESNWPYDINPVGTDDSKPLIRRGKRITEANVKKRKLWSSGIEYVPEHREGGILVRSYVASTAVMLLHYIIRGCHEVLLYDLALLSGNNNPQFHPIAALPHPQFGAVTAVNCSVQSSTIFYEFNNLADPCSVYRAMIRRSPASGFVELSFDQLCRVHISGLDFNRFDIHQELINDVTETCQVPIFIFGQQEAFANPRSSVGDFRQKPTDRAKAPRPCIIFTYGGYGVSSMAVFSIPFLMFAKAFDGLVCIVNAQGGGEIGRVWHARGHMKFKHRPIDDVITVAEYLIKKNYTTAGQLSLYSGTIGGMVCMRAAIRRPDLFSAVAIDDGIFDLLSQPRRSKLMHEQDIEDQEPSHMTSSRFFIASPTNASKNSSDKSLAPNSNTGESVAASKSSFTFMDAKKTHRSIESDLSWVDEVGDAGNAPVNQEEYQRILHLSPIHNLREFYCPEEFRSEHDELRFVPGAPASSHSPAMAVTISSIRSGRHHENQEPEDITLDRLDGSHSGTDDEGSEQFIAQLSSRSVDSIVQSPARLEYRKPPPAILLCTAVDSKVHPSHTYKMITELQRLATINHLKEHPIIARVETDDDRNKTYNEMYRHKLADILGFIAHHTNASVKDDAF